MSSERRVHRRFPISEVLLFRREGGGSGNRYRTAQARDISEGGLFFETEELVFEGERLELAFRQRSAFCDTQIRAEVVRVVETPNGYGVACRFLPVIVSADEHTVSRQGALR